MDYGKDICTLLEHLDEHRTPHNVCNMIQACGFAIGQAAGMLTTMEAMENMLAVVNEAIRREALNSFAANHEITGEAYLKHYFQPEKQHG